MTSALDVARDPYAPTITRVIERGIDLALAEMADKEKGAA